MQKKFFIILFLISLYILNLSAQTGVSINTTGTSAAPSAILDVSSVDKGVLIPRVDLISTTNSSPIINPEVSLLVYNNATSIDVTPGYYYWDGNMWVRVSTGNNPGTSSGNSWELTGNANTDPNTDFIGTTDNNDLVFRTNDLEQLRLTIDGNLGLGTNLPESILDIDGSIATRTSVANINSTSLNVNTHNTSHIILISTGATPTTPWLFTLTDGKPGQLLILELQSGYASLAYSDNVVLTSPYAEFLYPYSALTLKWNNLDSNWVELSRNAFLNSSAVYYNNKQVFTYSGGVQTFIVPPYVNQVFVKMWGAGGGGGAGTGGAGAFVSGYLDVSPGIDISVIVGGGGSSYSQESLNEPGGYGGGGDGGKSKAGSGGGRSALQIIPGEDIVTAGGGGGAGSYTKTSTPNGGGGGAPNGLQSGKSISNSGFGAFGGTLVAGGNSGDGDVSGTKGSLQQGGKGADSSYGGGGGGGGFYGGGGGGASSAQTRNNTGGGGGSSYTSNLTSVTNTAGGTGSSTAPQSNDVDYVQGVARGGGKGGDGLVVIYW